MNENPNQDYTILGGWLLVWYWCLMVGAILILVSMALPALFSISASNYFGKFVAGMLVSIAAACVYAVFNIKAAMELKARKPQFFDTIVLGMLILLGGGIISKFIMLRSAFGVTGLIGSTLLNVIGMAIGLGLCIMYLSKSARVNTYFGERPLKTSQHWHWIRMLPDFIISDAAFDPSKLGK